MDFCLSTAVRHVHSGCNMFIQTTDLFKRRHCLSSNAICLASRKGGFGPDTSKKEKLMGVIDTELLNDILGVDIILNPSILKSKDAKKMKDNSSYTSETRNFTSGEPKTRVQKSPQLSSGNSQNLSNAVLDQQFLEKVEAVRRSALEKKKSEEDKIYQTIDYDALIEPEQNTIGFGNKVGIGVAILVFGLVFALGDFLPYGSVNSTEDAVTIGKKLTEEEKSILKMKLAEYKKTLSESPEDPTALEGSVVTMEDLGEYEEASSLLEKLTEESPNNADALRLLGDVKFELKDFDGSASAYKKSLSASDIIDFDVLRGLTNSLLAAKHPDTAIQILLNYQKKLSDKNVGEKLNTENQSQNIDPVQVDLLLGKAYSDWGHVSDAVAIYDQLISKHPDDFRGYLAKGITLKENGSTGDAERMFIQARFFAPEKMKALVDRYSGK